MISLGFTTQYRARGSHPGTSDIFFLGSIPDGGVQPKFMRYPTNLAANLSKEGGGSISVIKVVQPYLENSYTFRTGYAMVRPPRDLAKLLLQVFR